jgi:hypothetical protein
VGGCRYAFGKLDRHREPKVDPREFGRPVSAVNRYAGQHISAARATVCS